MRLVDERPGQAGGAIVEADQGEVVERGGPVIVEVARDPDLAAASSSAPPGVGRPVARGARADGAGPGHVFTYPLRPVDGCVPGR
ncbi:MAG: hypothetical protein QOG22_1306 [Pseudonocardiales bacterium]|nr:hypothetical protein [Pseudonocardiales bacterium]